MECLGARVRLPGSPLDPTTYWLHDFGRSTLLLRILTVQGLSRCLSLRGSEREESEIVYLECLARGGPGQH